MALASTRSDQRLDLAPTGLSGGPKTLVTIEVGLVGAVVAHIAGVDLIMFLYTICLSDRGPLPLKSVVAGADLVL